MSFDILYQPCRFGTKPALKKNPFTGEVQTVFPVEPLTFEDRKAVENVLRSVMAVGPDEHGCYHVRLGDGGEVEVQADSGFATGMATSHRELTADSLRLLFELLRAADWVMLPAIEGNPAIVAVSGRAKGLGDKFPEVVCGSAEELGAVLIKGIVEWKRYRDQIVDG